MPQQSDLREVEKVEEVTASQATVLGESALPNVNETSRDQTDVDAASDHSSHEGTQDGAADLELAPVSTGPVYSVFSPWQKRYIVIMVTWAAFISPTSANIYFPALNPLARQLDVSNTLINLTLTSYMIFQGLAPTVFGDLADMAGYVILVHQGEDKYSLLLGEDLLTL